MRKTNAKTYVCPVCGNDKNLIRQPYKDGIPSLDICKCCGFQFGYDDDDQGKTFDSWRQDWIVNKKAEWQYDNDGKMPENWDKQMAFRQLENLKEVQFLEFIFDTIETSGYCFSKKYTIDEYIELIEKKEKE